ncbi:MAG: DUF2304 domain-containing protein [Planctomycetes bacterium]|nr:DUF2304 domain-containing protein [Planctomycetota bacterium]
MPIQQKVVVIGTAIVVCLVIFELVRKRMLREEYSWLWLLAGVAIGLVSLTPFRFLQFFSSRVLGSENPPAAIFFLGFVAVTLLCLQFSVRLSRMTEQIKNLGQKIGILEAQLRMQHTLPPDASLDEFDVLTEDSAPDARPLPEGGGESPPDEPAQS